MSEERDPKISSIRLNDDYHVELAFWPNETDAWLYKSDKIIALSDVVFDYEIYWFKGEEPMPKDVADKFQMIISVIKNK